MPKHARQTRPLKKTIDGYRNDPRLHCCLEAAGEIKTLMLLVQRCVEEADSSPLQWQTRAILARVARLCDTVQNALDDEMVTTEQIAAVVAMEQEPN